jgi:hypothetical protein
LPPKALPRLDNSSFRDAFQRQERHGLSLREVAIRCDWWTHDKKKGIKKPDSSRVARALGLTKTAGVLREHCSIREAERLCRALHLDPWEVGL